MMNGKNILWAAVLVSGAHPPVSNQPPPKRPLYGPPEHLSGTYVGGWERSNFEGCWLDFTEEAGTDFLRLLPKVEKAQRERLRLKLNMLGRRSIQPIQTPPARYGHMGAYSCGVEATKILSVEVVVDR